MSEKGIRNMLRVRAVLQSRAFKQLFSGEVEMAEEDAAEPHPVARLFRVDGGSISRDGEAVLADLRDFCFAQKSTFHPDARVQAQREGRREVWLRIMNFLNLDETQVQKLMEVDDGL